MGARQISDTVFVLEDKLTFHTALISGVLLAMVAIAVYLSFPIFYREPISWYFAALFMAGDVFFLLSARKVKITIDKAARMMTVEKFTIVGTKVFQIPTVKISKIALKQEGTLRKLNIPVIRFYLEDGRVLSYDYMVDEVFDASVLASFLGVPLVPDMGERQMPHL